MAKKKRKKSGSFLEGVGGFLSGTLRLVVRMIPLALLVAACGGVFFGVKGALYADGGMSIQRVTIYPVEALTGAQRERLESQLLGKNILQADIQDAAAQIEKDPGILQARLIRRFPSEVAVQVTRRVPIAFMKFSNRGVCGVVSEDGMVLGMVNEKDAAGLMIDAAATGLPEPGIGKHVPQRGFDEAIRFLKAYQENPLSRYEAVTKIVLDHLGNVSILLGGEPVIRLGRRPADRIGEIEKVLPLLDGAGRKNIDYIDLQFENVIVKQKRGGQ